METPEKEPSRFQSINLALVFFLAGLLCLWPNWYLSIVTSILLIGSIITQAIAERSGPSLTLTAYLIIFLGSAAAGVWAAYAYPQALTKFLTLSNAALLAIYLSQFQNLKSIVPKLLAASSVIFSIAFLGILLLDITQGELLTPNRFAGLIGILTPFLVLIYLNTESTFQKYMYLGGGFIAFLALVASGSRGGVVALVIGLGLWMILTTPKIDSRNSKHVIIVASWGFLILIGTMGLFYSQQLEASLFSLIPGSRSRLTLYTNLQSLISDYWLLGGGLNNFSGHYSQYVLSIPHLRFTYGHHLYLDLILEQGIIGFASFCLLIISSFVFLLAIGRKDKGTHHFVGAILASLTTLVLHGFIDNAIYSNSGSTMLFVAPALAFSMSKNNQAMRLTRSINLAFSSIFIVAALVFSSNVTSAWHSNIGAIEMAKIELIEWPTGEWSEGQSAELLQPLIPRFETALEQNQENASAEYRLGLIDMEKREFSAAVSHLAKAHAINPAHIGIKKNLGYALLWSGDTEQAKAQLQGLEGIHNELEAYRWWWQRLNRPDLSEIAHNAHQTGIALQNE